MTDTTGPENPGPPEGPKPEPPAPGEAAPGAPEQAQGPGAKPTTSETSPPSRSRRFGPLGAELLAFAELLAICGLALAQPTFSILGKNSSVLVQDRAGAGTVVAFVLFVVLVPPLALYAAEVLVGLVVPRARRWAHLAALGFPLWLLSVEVIKRYYHHARRDLAIAVIITLVLLAAYHLLKPIREWLRFLAVAPLAFALLFVLSGPVQKASFSSSEQDAAHVTVRKPVPVVMVVFDEFALESLLDGSGHINSAMFPNFAALAAGSNWYRNSTTVAPFTDVAVPAIETGLMPTAENTPPNAASYPKSIFTLLGGSYRERALESDQQVCPTNICPEGGSRGGGGFTTLLNDAYQAWFSFTWPYNQVHNVLGSDVGGDASEAVTAVSIGKEFTASLGNGSGRTLDYLHVLLPHQPWTLLADQRPYKLPHTYLGLSYYTWDFQPAADSARVRHLLQAQASDVLLGKVITALKHTGAYSKSLIVVTADHGVAFTAGEPQRGVGPVNWPQIAWTPLFVKLPGQTQGRIDDRPVESVDVVPTIADVLGVKVPWKLPGRSVLGPPRAEGKRPMFEWSLNTLQPISGKYIQLDGAKGFQQVLAARPAVPGPDPALAAYRVGPFGSLVGSSVSTLPGGSPSALSAEVDHPSRLTDYRPAASPATAMATGTVTRPPASDTALLLAVDGRIAGQAVIAYSPFRDRNAWWANVPTSLLHAGHNRLGLYQVVGSGTTLTLEPLNVSGG